MKTTLANNELDILAHYLIGHRTSSKTRRLYEQAVSRREYSAADRRVLEFALTHPRLIGLLDGGLAISRPNAELRVRLYLVLSLLETVPEDAEMFLPKRYSLKSWGSLLLSGVQAVYRVLAGIFIIKILRFYK